jgi:branched-chain amino acid transport system substrate-binding protein
MAKALGGHVFAVALGLSIAVASAQAADPIKLGAIYSLMGTYVVTEAPALKAARLAVREINDSGGIRGRPIELIHIDGKSDQAAVVAATRHLVHRAGVIAIVGVFDSAFFRNSAVIAQDAGIPYICTGGTQPDLPALIGPFAHMMAFGDDQQAYVAAPFAAQDLGAETAFVLYNAELNYTRGAARFFKERFREHGGLILGQGSYLSGDTDYASITAAILGMKAPPDVIYAAMNPSEAGSFVRQARERSLNMPIIGTDAFDTPKLVQDAGVKNAEQVFFTTHMALSDENRTISAYVEGYEQAFGVPPANGFAGLGYDSVHLLAEAMRHAKTLTPEAINDAIFGLTKFEGVTGETDFSDPRRAPDKEVTLMAVRHGVFKAIGKRRSRLTSLPASAVRAPRLYHLPPGQRLTKMYTCSRVIGSSRASRARSQRFATAAIPGPTATLPRGGACSGFGRPGRPAVQSHTKQRREMASKNGLGQPREARLAPPIHKVSAVSSRRARAPEGRPVTPTAPPTITCSTRHRGMQACRFLGRHAKASLTPAPPHALVVGTASSARMTGTDSGSDAAIPNRMLAMRSRRGGPAS